MQSGIQSAAHPTSLCSEPGRVMIGPWAVELK